MLCLLEASNEAWEVLLYTFIAFLVCIVLPCLIVFFWQPIEDFFQRRIWRPLRTVIRLYGEYDNIELSRPNAQNEEPGFPPRYAQPPFLIDSGTTAGQPPRADISGSSSGTSCTISDKHLTHPAVRKPPSPSTILPAMEDQRARSYPDVQAGRTRKWNLFTRAKQRQPVSSDPASPLRRSPSHQGPSGYGTFKETPSAARISTSPIIKPGTTLTERNCPHRYDKGLEHCERKTSQTEEWLELSMLPLVNLEEDRSETNAELRNENVHNTNENNSTSTPDQPPSPTSSGTTAIQQPAIDLSGSSLDMSCNIFDGHLSDDDIARKSRSPPTNQTPKLPRARSESDIQDYPPRTDNFLIREKRSSSDPAHPLKGSIFERQNICEGLAGYGTHHGAFEIVSPASPNSGSILRGPNISSPHCDEEPVGHVEEGATQAEECSGGRVPLHLDLAEGDSEQNITSSISRFDQPPSPIQSPTGITAMQLPSPSDASCTISDQHSSHDDETRSTSPSTNHTTKERLRAQSDSDAHGRQTLLSSKKQHHSGSSVPTSQLTELPSPQQNASEASSGYDTQRTASEAASEPPSPLVESESAPMGHDSSYPRHPNESAIEEETTEAEGGDYGDDDVFDS